MKTNLKSLRRIEKNLSESILKKDELLGIRGGGDNPPVIVPE